MKRIVLLIGIAALFLAAMISPATIKVRISLAQRIKDKIFLILGVIAVITGIILELMGYDAVVEGLVIQTLGKFDQKCFAVGFFLIHANEKTRDEIRSSAERIIEAIESKET
jgi:hypothetical protein